MHAYGSLKIWVSSWMEPDNSMHSQNHCWIQIMSQTSNKHKSVFIANINISTIRDLDDDWEIRLDKSYDCDLQRWCCIVISLYITERSASIFIGIYLPFYTHIWFSTLGLFHSHVHAQYKTLQCLCQCVHAFPSLSTFANSLLYQKNSLLNKHLQQKWMPSIQRQPLLSH